GVATSGEAVLGNGGNGVFVEGDAATDTIKTLPSSVGDAGGDGNVISGNGGKGVVIQGEFVDSGGATVGSLVLGNKIGTNAAGGNTINGNNNGVRITGSLAEGVRIEDNNIGKNGVGTHLQAGVKFIKGGARAFVSGNGLFNIGDVGVDIQAEADGDYTVTGNNF